MKHNIGLLLTVSTLPMATPALAQTVDPIDPVSSEAAVPDEEQADGIVVIGSRFGERIATDSPTPVDTISREELTAGGETELQNMLRVTVPSFNTARPQTSGVADFLRSPTLRGLSPGQTLVLINGRRRHTNSDLNVGNQQGRGDVAYNFNAIPAIALKRVEILRDGASAQYGADAVAGIVNLVMDDALGGDLFATGGITSRGDGEKFTTGLGYGWALGDGGFIRATGQFQKQDFSNRSRADTRQQYFGNNGAARISDNFGSGTGLTPSNGTLDPREQTINRRTFSFGQPAYENYSAFVNSALPVRDGIELYAFGGYSRLSGQVANFFRRAGQDETVRAIYPDGFLPFQEIDLTDYSAAVGFRGDDLVGFGWDISTVYGTSETDQGYSNSNNVSFGVDSPTNFDRGGTRLRQWTTNLDLTRQFDIGGGSPLNLAFGGEYRRERFLAVAGEPASFQFGGVPILDGPSAGRTAPAGAQPSPGTSPEEEVDESRDNIAVYAELEKEWNNRLLVSVAGRYENYSDFGSTTNFKVASRFSITDRLNLRGSIGSSFRAPALPQQFFQRSEISFAGGNPTSTRIVSTNSDLAPVIGARSLTPETSDNISLGATYKAGGLSASIDVYQIKLDDRIVLSSQFSSPALTTLLQANGFGAIRAVSFETNSVDTTTRGVDLNLRYRSPLFGGDLTSTLGASFIDTDLDRVAAAPAELRNLGITTDLFDLRSQVRLTDGAPQSKIALNFNWNNGPFTINLTNIRYGEFSQADLTGRTQVQVDALIPGFDTTVVPGTSPNRFDIIETFGAKVVTDISVAYDLTPKVTLKVGADNVFDVFPDEQVATTVENTRLGTAGSDNRGTFPYSYLSPFGVAGAYLYGSLITRF